MAEALSVWRLGSILRSPSAVFARLGEQPPSAASAFFRFALWLTLLPPLFAYIGTTTFGWRLGVAPIVLPNRIAAAVSAAYFVLLLFGLLSTAAIAKWMAKTYGASDSLGASLAFVAVVGVPLALGSAAHLYPHAFLNVIVLVPALIWSMYLLYRGLPIALRTEPERGMLMASALLAYLLVAWVSLLGLTVVLWSRGLGPGIAA
ncbi:MAG TPA: Yip1 family protein [Gammaproteobacteria bacterium]